MSRHALMPWLALLLVSCVTQDELASQLKSAAISPHLPKVVACWETAFEESGFTGSHLAVVDFTVTAEGAIRDASVRELRNTDGEGDGAPYGFEECLVEALEASDLSAGGFAPGRDLVVKGFRFAFADATKDARREASEDSPSFLIGPRADRCQGLFGHDPPRDVLALQSELAKAQGDAAAAKSDRDRDRQARALQRSYDLALELRERLSFEAVRDDLSSEGRDRVIVELERAGSLADTVGDEIGCTPP